MKLHHTALAAALVAMQVGLCPSGALASERDCAGMVVEADADVRGRWPDLVERIQSQLSARADMDRCVEVRVRLLGDAAILVSVTLADGRAASRALTEPDDVIPTLQGLLHLPVPAPSSLALAAASSPAPAALHRNTFIDRTRPTERDELPAARAARSLGIELSLFTGARIGDGQLGIGAGALSLVELNRWLVGFVGRADSYRALGGDEAETALELAVLAGRRFDLGRVALDLTAGLGAAMKGSSSSQRGEFRREGAMNPGPTPDTPPPLPSTESRSGPVPRLLLGTRLGFGPRSVLRAFVGIDGEVGPALASPGPSSARLPGYSVGLSAGVTLGTQ